MRLTKSNTFTHNQLRKNKINAIVRQGLNQDIFASVKLLKHEHTSQKRSYLLKEKNYYHELKFNHVPLHKITTFQPKWSV